MRSRSSQSKTEQRYLNDTMPRIAKALEKIAVNWESTRIEAGLPKDRSAELSGASNIDVTKMSYPEVMDFCRQVEAQKIISLLEKHRGHNVLRLCAIEMEIISKDDDEFLKKNKVVALKKKLVNELGIDYKKYGKCTKTKDGG